MKTIRIIFLMLLLIPFLFITSPAQNKAAVKGANVVIRDKPHSDGKIIFRVEKGDILKIEPGKQKKDWQFVSVNKRKGWVRFDKIEIVMENPTKKTVWLYIGNSEKVNNFSVRYYLSAAQIARHGNRLYFWTKMTANNKKSYLNYLLGGKIKTNAADFLFNADLWEGNCSLREIRIIKSTIYWKNGTKTRYKLPVSKVNASGNSAARSILIQACKASRR